jgi:small subunit ribosomal protein S2
LIGAQSTETEGEKMAVISMKALLESGVHFGHRTNKWDPRMKPYIFTERNGIHIIDLQLTVKSLNNAYAVVRDAVMGGGTVLFIGTKRQAQETVREEAIRCGMPYVTERWLGGMLTNWNTMHARVQEMERLENLRDSGDINRLTKKEGLLIGRDITRLNIRLDGVRSMKRLPDLLFIVDVSREYAAVHEANLLNIPIVALVDTNCNPQDIDYVIPSNDDAIRAIKLLVGKVAEAVLEGKSMRKDDEIAQEQAAATAGTAPTPGRRPAPNVDMDVDETDEALLGKATLAKLAKTAEPEAAAAVSEPEVQAAAAIETKAEPVVEAEAKPATPARAGGAREKAKAEAEPVVEAEAKPVKKAKAEAEPVVEAEAKPAKKAKAEAEPVVEAEAKSATPARAGGAREKAKASKSEETPADAEE